LSQRRATPDIYPLSLHDALPILVAASEAHEGRGLPPQVRVDELAGAPVFEGQRVARLGIDELDVDYATRREVHAGLVFALAPKRDRKSTRLNSSHVSISYAVFCL